MTTYITGIGTWVPLQIVSNCQWPLDFFERAAQRAGDRTFNDIAPSSDAKMAEIVERDLLSEAKDPMLGSVFRHKADDQLGAWQAMVYAAQIALSRAGLDGSDIDLVLSFSMVPDRITPPDGVRVAHSVGATGALAIGVDTVCASAVTQIEVARRFVEAGVAKNVLLVQSHLMLRTVPIMHPASPGLGDGASALIVSKDPGRYKVLSTFGITHGEFAEAVIWLRNPDNTPWWLAGGSIRAGSLDLEGVKYLMRETVAFGANSIRTAASRAGIDVSQISVIASVQPRGFIPGAIAQGLNLPRDVAVTTYMEVAHLGACGPVFNLEKAEKTGRMGPGAYVALYGQGSGFTRAAAILQAV